MAQSFSNMPHKTHFLLPPSAFCQDVELVLIKPNIPDPTLADHEPSLVLVWQSLHVHRRSSWVSSGKNRTKFSGKRRIINEGQKWSPISVKLHFCSICANLVSNSWTSFLDSLQQSLPASSFFTTKRKLMMQNLNYGTSQGGFSRLHIWNLRDPTALQYYNRESKMGGGDDLRPHYHVNLRICCGQCK